MTNPKLREMLAEMFAKEIGPPVGNPEWLAKHGPRLQKRRNQTAEKWADAALAVFTQYLQEPEVVEWRVRGVGVGAGRDLRTGALLEYAPDLSGFVTSKRDGGAVVAMFNGRAHLDYRPSEPNWIQVKVCCEDKAVLNDLCKAVIDNDYKLTPVIAVAALNSIGADATK